jgi:hypothetical protein
LLPSFLFLVEYAYPYIWNIYPSHAITRYSFPGESGKTLNCLLAGNSNGEGEGPDGGRSLRIHNLSETKDKIFSKSVIDQIKLVYHEVTWEVYDENRVSLFDVNFAS